MIFKKFPLLSIVLSIVGILLSVLAFIMIQVASKVNNADDGLSILAIIELVLSVLFLAALTARRPIFTRIICIITMAMLLTASFVISIVSSVSFQLNEVTWDSVSYLSISILTLVVLVLFFVYFLIGRKGTLRIICKVTNFFSLGFLAIFAILLFVSAFAGTYSKQPLYATEMGLLLVNACVFLVLQLLLQKTLVYEEE